jgi:uncharacterized protein YbjT (DUF2867 family)
LNVRVLGGTGFISDHLVRALQRDAKALGSVRAAEDRWLVARR